MYELNADDAPRALELIADFLEKESGVTSDEQQRSRLRAQLEARALANGEEMAKILERVTQLEATFDEGSLEPTSPRSASLNPCPKAQNGPEA